MKAFLIDPFQKQISEIEYSGIYQDIYSLLDIDLFTVVTITGDRDAIFVDDEGLLKDPEKQSFFYVSHESGILHGHVMLAGKGLVLGCNNDGESVEPKITIELLKERIHWAMPSEAMMEAEKLLSESGKVYSFDSHEDLMKFLNRGE